MNLQLCFINNSESEEEEGEVEGGESSKKENSSTQVMSLTCALEVKAVGQILVNVSIFSFKSAVHVYVNMYVCVYLFTYSMRLFLEFIRCDSMMSFHMSAGQVASVWKFNSAIRF